MKQGFKRSISWKEYRLEKTTQAKNNNLDYLFRLFELSLKNGNNGSNRNSFQKYYKPLLEIKDWFDLNWIDYKPFFD